MNSAFKTLPWITSEAELRRVLCRGKRTISAGQHVWVRYILSTWGSVMGGSTAQENCGGASVIGRLMIRGDWDQASADRIIHAVNTLYEMGVRGDSLFERARELAIPQSTAKYWLEIAQAEDDAKFIERVMIGAINKNSPMRTVGILRHCARMNAHQVAKTLIHETGCDLQAARKRISWCEKILEETLYYAIRREMQKEPSSTFC